MTRNMHSTCLSGTWALLCFCGWDITVSQGPTNGIHTSTLTDGCTQMVTDWTSASGVQVFYCILVLDSASTTLPTVSVVKTNWMREGEESHVHSFPCNPSAKLNLFFLWWCCHLMTNIFFHLFICFHLPGWVLRNTGVIIPNSSSELSASWVAACLNWWGLFVFFCSSHRKPPRIACFQISVEIIVTTGVKQKLMWLHPARVNIIAEL